MAKLVWTLKIKTPKDHTDEELLDMLSKYKSIYEMAWLNSMSASTLYRRFRKIKGMQK